MKLTFLGTRGYIEARNRRHRRHSALVVAYRGARLLIDRGEDWRGELPGPRPRAIALTHAHPDHVGGLSDGAPCPVYATAVTWERIEDYPIERREWVEPREPFRVAEIILEAFPVEHSLRAPAVGYRISAGRVTVFYVPDVVYIEDREAALRGAKLYIGDGATVVRPLVRRRDDRLIGHATIRTQLAWCGKEGVPRAIFTHCGTRIVAGDERKLGPRVRRMGEERGVRAGIAHDGMEVVLR